MGSKPVPSASSPKAHVFSQRTRWQLSPVFPSSGDRGPETNAKSLDCLATIFRLRLDDDRRVASDARSSVVTRRLRAMGIRDRPTAPASPWQNGFVERLIGSIRRECVDHIIVLGEMHLRRALKSYADYYNCVRTHRSLNKDAPVTRQIQRIGSIKSRAILGGLHHRYARV
jgi:Integrase core domain